MRPVSRGNSRGSLEGHTTCRKTPIPWSTFDQNQTPGHLFEGKPVDEGTTRRGTDTPCIFRKNPQVPHTAPQVVCHLVNNSRSKRSSIPPHKTMPDSPVTTLGTLHTESEMERKPEVPASPRGEALFRCARPSGVPRGPATSTGSLASQRHPGKFPKVPGRRRGKGGFPAAPRQRPRESFFNASQGPSPLP